MKRTRWVTSRKILSVVLLALSSFLLWNGKVTSGDWVLLMLGVLAGHHGAEMIKAFKGGG